MSAHQRMRPSKTTAYHEAGHAIAAARIGFVFDRVVLGYDGATEALGWVEWTEYPEEPDFPSWPKWMHAMVLMCGPFAEARYCKQRIGTIWGATSSLSDARSVNQLGLSDDEFLAHVRDAVLLVWEQWPAIARTAMDLLAVGELSFDDIEDRVIWPAARTLSKCLDVSRPMSPKQPTAA